MTAVPLILLVVLALGGIPFGYRAWGPYYGGGGLAVVAVILLIVLLLIGWG